MPASRRTFTHAARHCSSVPYRCSNSASVSPCMIARIDPIPCSPDSILHRFCGGRKGADWLISGLRNAERGRIVLCDMTEERPHGGQSHVPGLCGVLPLRLEVVEEGEDKIAVEIGDRQCTGLALRTLGGEQDQ